jgi:HEPN pEK499 p136
MQNLLFIEEHKTPNGPFEVTQLLNSFLGALAHPWEAYQNELCAKRLVEAAMLGWPNIAKERPRDRDPETLGDLVRLMRNAIAHGNVEFLPGSATDIKAIRVWNTDRDRIRYACLPHVFCKLS